MKRSNKVVNHPDKKITMMSRSIDQFLFSTQVVIVPSTENI